MRTSWRERLLHDWRNKLAWTIWGAAIAYILVTLVRWLV